MAKIGVCDRNGVPKHWQCAAVWRLGCSNSAKACARGPASSAWPSLPCPTGNMRWRAEAPRPSGSAPRRTKRQREPLVQSLLRGARAAGFPTDLCTLARVAQVIEREFGIRYHLGHVWHLLRRMGWSPQKPARRARERDEEAIRQWREEEEPRMKKPANKAPPSS